MHMCKEIRAASEKRERVNLLTDKKLKYRFPHSITVS